MVVRTLLAVVLLLSFGEMIPAAQSSKPQAKKPNIIIFMVDDLGWNHISVNQATQGTHKKIFHTPHLEKLAKNGLTFTHAYAQPNCAPTRAAMLSGQYPARVNNGVYVVGHLNRFSNKKGRKGAWTRERAQFRGPDQSQDVPGAAITLAEALKMCGYVTAHIGKFHVGGNSGMETMPENNGFDINLGGHSAGHQKVCFASKMNSVWVFKGTGQGAFTPYAEPYTKAYVKKHGFPESLVGTPKHITDALGDAMEDNIRKFSEGKKPFFLQFHTYAVHGPVKSRPDLLQAALKRGAKGKLASYAGFISSVDLNVGRMLAVLEDPNGDGDTSDSILNDTLILFTSDNGGTHTDNLPLRGVKGMFTEGGIRVPLIAHWPGVIPPNTVTGYMVHCVDYYPTCLELAGNIWTPPEAKHPLDGKSFADILRQPHSKRNRDPIFFLFPGYMDYRAQPCVGAISDIGEKRYKLFYYYEGNSWELYCLTDDQKEAKNIVKRQPEIARIISRQIDQWLNQEHPTWNPKYPLDKKSMKSVGPPPPLR